MIQIGWAKHSATVIRLDSVVAHWQWPSHAASIGSTAYRPRDASLLKGGIRPCGSERHGLFTSVNKIAAKLVSAKASRKITEVHNLFLFMAFHKVTLE